MRSLSVAFVAVTLTLLVSGCGQSTPATPQLLRDAVEKQVKDEKAVALCAPFLHGGGLAAGMNSTAGQVRSISQAPYLADGATTPRSVDDNTYIAICVLEVNPVYVGENTLPIEFVVGWSDERGEEIGTLGGWETFD